MAKKVTVTLVDDMDEESVADVISRSAMGVHHDQDETCTLTPCTVVAGLSTGVPRRAVWTQVLPWMSAMGLFSSW